MAKQPPKFEIDAIHLMTDFKQLSKDLSETHKARMLDVYQSWSIFKGKKEADWATAFKVNKAHQVVETVLPRLTAKDPKWVVSNRLPDTNPEFSVAIQDYLTYIFDEYNLMESVRAWAKSGVIYGNGYARVKYKYEIARIIDRDTKETVEGAKGEDENGVGNVKFKEEVVGEYPTIENVSWTDIYLDPRYPLIEDMPGVIMRQNGVRLGDLKKDDKYFNLDKVEDLGNLQEFKDDENGYKSRILSITGLTNLSSKKIVDTNSLTVDTYYGYFNKTEDPEKEKTI